MSDELLDSLTGPVVVQVRAAEVARGRRKAVARAFDSTRVYEEIASQLLMLSSSS